MAILSLFRIASTLSYSERYIYYWRRSQVIRNYIDLTIANDMNSFLYDRADKREAGEISVDLIYWLLLRLW